WATVIFGLRFSNLTYRGVITNGPYAYSRHPAYLAKNLSWWLVSIPFFPVAGWRLALFYSLCLLVINSIYWVRAVTEERHLLNYSKYRAYWRFMQAKGYWLRIFGIQVGRGRVFRVLRRYPLLVTVVLIILAVLIRPTESSFLAEKISISMTEENIIAPAVFYTVNDSGVVQVNDISTLWGNEERPAQPFPLASLSKPITAYMARQMEIEGLLDVGNLVGDYFPEKFKSVLSGITLADLIMHRSGLGGG